MKKNVTISLSDKAVKILKELADADKRSQSATVELLLAEEQTRRERGES